MLNIVLPGFFSFNQKKCCVSKISWKFGISNQRRADRRVYRVRFLGKATCYIFPGVQALCVNSASLDFLEIMSDLARWNFLEMIWFFLERWPARQLLCCISDRAILEYKIDYAHEQKYQLVSIHCPVSMLINFVIHKNFSLFWGK